MRFFMPKHMRRNTCKVFQYFVEAQIRADDAHAVSRSDMFFAENFSLAVD
jgi:hypothetical protein